MIETKLGKISNVKFGHVGYQESGIGIQFALEGSGWGVIDSKSFWDPNIIKWDKNSKWSESDSDKAFSDIVRYISHLLKEAKVDDISRLKGIPVECTFAENTLRSWRILTEVL